MPKLRHIVLFPLNTEVDAATEAKAIAELTRMGQNNPDILEWTIAKSLNTAKGVVLVENALFTSVEAMEAFRASDIHREVGNFMSGIAGKWHIGEYLE